MTSLWKSFAVLNFYSNILFARKMLTNRLIHILKKTTCRHFSGASGVPTQYTLVREENGVREIKLNDAKTRNSLTIGMLDSLQQSLSKNKDNEELRCIVISAEGSVWSAGHNMKELHASDNSQKLLVFQQLAQVIKCMRNLPVPVLAKVNGLATAAGLQLMASCDLVISSDKSKFSTPGVNFGIFCSTPGVAITRVMHPLRANHMLITGSPIGAKEALEAGLISRLVAEDELDSEVECVVSQIKAKSRAVVALGKQFLYQQMEMKLDDAYEEGSKKMVENLNLCDGQEGLNSFVEKRAPKWHHK